MGWEEAMYVISKLKKQIGDGIISINNNINGKAADIKNHVSTTINKTMNDIIKDVLLPALPENRDPLSYSNVQWYRPTYTISTPDEAIHYSFSGQGIYGMHEGQITSIIAEGEPYFKMIPVTINGKGTVMFNNMAFQKGWNEINDENEGYNKLFAENKITIDNGASFIGVPMITSIPGLLSYAGVYYKGFWKFDFSKKLICEDGNPYHNIKDLYSNYDNYDSSGSYKWRKYSTDFTYTGADIMGWSYTQYREEAKAKWMEAYTKDFIQSTQYAAPISKTSYLVYLA